MKRWQCKNRAELIKSIMRTYPDQVAVEIIERHTKLKQTFTEIAHVLGLHRHTVKYKYERALKKIRARVEAREKNAK